jgi:hypothetical protein
MRRTVPTLARILAFAVAPAIGGMTIAAAADPAGQHPPAAPEAHHAAVDARGAHVMGFDQQRTVHRFRLYEDGGAIEVAVKDPENAADRDAIRQHLPHIATLFRQGRFDAPMLVHATVVPGTDDLARLKADVTYTYVETPAGGRVDIVTRHPEALAALHRFLAFQIADHRTGDPTAVARRP